MFAILITVYEAASRADSHLCRNGCNLRQNFVRSCEATSFAHLAAARLFVSHAPDRNLEFYRLK